MLMDMASFGLLFLLFGWVVQLYHSFKAGNEIHPLFIILYAVGLAALVADGFTSGELMNGVFNFSILVVSLMILATITRADACELQKGRQPAPKRRK